MTTEEPRGPLAPEPNWASYIDTLRNTAVPRRSRESRFADAPSETGEKKLPVEPVNWADYVDKLYIDQLMLSLDQ
jgi:hypothetical protein